MTMSERSSYSADWRTQSCLLQLGSPASSSNSASCLQGPSCPRHLPQTQCRWQPSPRLQRHRPQSPTSQKRSLDKKTKFRWCCATWRQVETSCCVCQWNPPMGVLCLSDCFSWLIRGGVAPAAGPISSPSLGSVKWKEISVVEKHSWNQMRSISVNCSH